MGNKLVAGIDPWGYFSKRAVEETDKYSGVLVERSPRHFDDSELETFFTSEQVRAILIEYETKRDDDYLQYAYSLGYMRPEKAVDEFLEAE